ncbi:hypothetical protein KJ885_04825 [Patescibacteria group bacterium]|nr:hypothetical protein [Patescibacteria group bacterium]
MKLFHIGKRPPKPEPRRHGDVWERPGRPDIQVGVFLTPRPDLVAINHGIAIYNVYAFDVSRKVIRDCGGILKYDRAPEIIISEEFWDKVRFIGRSRRWERRVEEALKEEERRDRHEDAKFLSESNKKKNRTLLK